MPDILRDELRISRLACRLYLSPAYRAAKALAPPALATALIALDVGAVTAIALAIGGLALIVWLPTLVGSLSAADMALASVDNERLTLSLEQPHSIPLAELRRIETRLAFWPGFRNRVTLTTQRGSQEIRTAIDFLPLYTLLRRVDQQLKASERNLESSTGN